MKPTTIDAYRLLHDGTLAHADVEANGIRIDVPRLERTIGKVGDRIGTLSDRLKSDPVYDTWRRTYGQKTSLGSRDQLAHVLFDVMELPCKSYTSGGSSGRRRPQADASNLERLDMSFVKGFLELEKLKKLQSTYLRGVLREVVDGYLRPSWNLHLVKTYRPSCDRPNFQNIPIRDKLIGKLIRRCFVPRDGHVLAEFDYGGHEFRIGACFWRDRAMIDYAGDPEKDIHRDMAAECYALEPGQVTGSTRFFAKNQFVFPTFYGSYYVNTARNLWNVIASAGLKTRDGVPLDEHLKGRGIGRRDFEGHVRGVEERFNERFREWSGRKEEWWDRYCRRGWFPLMTGFRVSGVYSRNQVYNTPVQGPAFHCLLWSLIRVNRELKERGLRSMIVGQIHDSLVMDVHRDELEEVKSLVRNVMAVEVREAWPWIVTPLEVECKVGERNWHEMRAVAV